MREGGTAVYVLYLIASTYVLWRVAEGGDSKQLYMCCVYVDVWVREGGNSQRESGGRAKKRVTGERALH